ncbi:MULTISPECIES: hypothetical protein [unclassified Agromyces]|uniref:hypothetical protein n=1 Tax=unclassified Agromyces TaxID=2639701 RepID=UPI0030148D5B
MDGLGFVNHREVVAGDDLGRLRDALPDASLVVVEPFWYTDERPPSVDRIIGWVADAAAEVGAELDEPGL